MATKVSSGWTACWISSHVLHNSDLLLEYGWSLSIGCAVWPVWPVVRAFASTPLTFPCNVLRQFVRHVDEYGVCIMQNHAKTSRDAIQPHSMQSSIARRIDARCNEMLLDALKRHSMHWNIARCKEALLDPSEASSLKRFFYIYYALHYIMTSSIMSRFILTQFIINLRSLQWLASGTYFPRSAHRTIRRKGSD